MSAGVPHPGGEMQGKNRALILSIRIGRRVRSQRGTPPAVQRGAQLTRDIAAGARTPEERFNFQTS